MEQDYEKLIKERVENLFHTMEQRVTPKEMEQIKAAYQLAHEAHKGQTRKSGSWECINSCIKIQQGLAAKRHFM